MKNNILVTLLLVIVLAGFFAIYPLTASCASDAKQCAPSPSSIVIPPTPTCTPTPEETPTPSIVSTITPQIDTAVAADNSNKQAGNSGEVQATAPTAAPATGRTN